MNKTVIIVVAVLVVLVGGYFVVTGMDKATPNTPANTQVNENDNQDTQPVVNVEVESDAEVTITTHQVVYTNSGYSPSALTVKAGDTVVFKNQSSGNVWTGSAMHPSHTVYGGTALQQHCPDAENDDFDQCKSEGPGTSWSFTFKKAGAWGYHNHMNSTHFGKITVQ